MPLLKTLLNPRSKIYQENAARMSSLVADVTAKLAHAAMGGHQKAQHLQQDKLLPRVRIDRLLDPHSPFLELSPLAAHGIYPEEIAGAGVITGIGRIWGQDCMIIALDATVIAGIDYPLTIKKYLRAQTIATENHLPCVYLLDFGEAASTEHVKPSLDYDYLEQIIVQQANMSALGIPQIAVVMGACVAHNVYLATMADECIMVNQTTLFLADPAAVRAVTGAAVSAEELGGADIHCRISGVADQYAHDEIQALSLARTSLSHLHRLKPSYPAMGTPCEPKYEPHELYGIMGTDPQQPYEVREIIARLVDGSVFDEFKPLYGNTLVCGFAHILGYPIGIIANNGILSSEAVLKATHFIQLCCQRGTPLLFLQHMVGVVAGNKHEMGGIIKHQTKFLAAVACAKVPKFTVVIGGSFESGHAGLCGRAFAPRFLWIWPSAHRVPLDPASPNQSVAEYPYYSTARLWDDGIIDPVDTRKVLGLSLRATSNAPLEKTQFSLFRM